MPMPTACRLYAFSLRSRIGKPAERSRRNQQARPRSYLRCRGEQPTTKVIHSCVFDSSNLAPFPLLVSEADGPMQVSTCMLFPWWLSPQTARVPPMLLRSRGSSTSALVCRVKAWYWYWFVGRVVVVGEGE